MLRRLRFFLHDLSFSELAIGHFLSTRIFLRGFGIIRVILLLGGLGQQGLEFVARLGLLGFGFGYDKVDWPKRLLRLFLLIEKEE